MALVLSIIGCAAGIAGLLIHFYRFLLEKPKLEIIVEDRMSYFFSASKFGVKHYTTNNCAVISLQVNNCSAFPITINAAYIKDKLKHKSRHSNEFVFYPSDIVINEKTTTSITPHTALKLPLRIESFDTAFFSIRLPFMDYFIKTDDKQIKFKLFLDTPRKSYCHSVKLYEYQFLYDLYHPDRKK